MRRALGVRTTPHSRKFRTANIPRGHAVGRLAGRNVEPIECEAEEVCDGQQQEANEGNSDGMYSGIVGGKGGGGGGLGEGGGGERLGER